MTRERDRIQENANGYIVKNCPCYDLGFCTSNQVVVRGCINCTDCVIKQIVKRCKDSMDYHSKDMFILGKTNMAGIVLALLQIEEIDKWQKK